MKRHVRIPDHLWEGLKAAAAADRRPLTQQLLVAIEEHLRRRANQPVGRLVP